MSCGSHRFLGIAALATGFECPEFHKFLAFAFTDIINSESVGFTGFLGIEALVTSFKCP